MIAVEAVAPSNATHLRVQHMGDPGTAELAGEIANRVTWKVGDLTGFYPPDSDLNFSQRGYRDLGPPVAASAFQLWCNGAGFLINTSQFSHAVAIVGAGPSASVARTFSSPPVLYRGPGSVLTIDAAINLKSVNYQASNAAEGVAQLSFFYYVKDSTSGTLFAHVVQVFDSRPLGIGGTGFESVGSDGQVAFVSSPLLDVDAAGSPPKYASAGPLSDRMHTVQPWGNANFFQAQVSYSKFKAMLDLLRGGPLPLISSRPEDYRLYSFGVLGEVFAGTSSDHNVTLGASVFDLRLTGG